MHYKPGELDLPHEELILPMNLQDNRHKVRSNVSAGELLGVSTGLSGLYAGKVKKIQDIKITAGHTGITKQQQPISCTGKTEESLSPALGEGQLALATV